MSFLFAASLIAFCTFFSSFCISNHKTKRPNQSVNKFFSHQKRNAKPRSVITSYDQSHHIYLGFGARYCDTLDGDDAANLSITVAG